MNIMANKHKYATTSVPVGKSSQKCSLPRPSHDWLTIPSVFTCQCIPVQSSQRVVLSWVQLNPSPQPKPQGWWGCCWAAFSWCLKNKMSWKSDLTSIVGWVSPAQACFFFFFLKINVSLLFPSGVPHPHLKSYLFTFSPTLAAINH